MHIDPAIFQLQVDVPATIFQMIAFGGYDYVAPLFNDSLIEGPTRVVDGRLIYFSDPTSSDEAIVHLGAMSFRPATLPELLSFGKTFPEEQRRYFIVALGAVLENDAWGNPLVPMLHGGSAARNLGALRRAENWFGQRMHLLAVNVTT